MINAAGTSLLKIRVPCTGSINEKNPVPVIGPMRPECDDQGSCASADYDYNIFTHGESLPVAVTGSPPCP
ncbi:MAG: hypothetical protein CVV34_04620 [Methanomicrobiales archaeon HGW-Methanomicrobiales-5]|nr:MAG: hypothetical protein CVV34_04620 [Methanomicrobiales archaeon HGW-Methanomicrobiales-5]